MGAACRMPCGRQGHSAAHSAAGFFSSVPHLSLLLEAPGVIHFWILWGSWMIADDRLSPTSSLKSLTTQPPAFYVLKSCHFAVVPIFSAFTDLSFFFFPQNSLSVGLWHFEEGNQS